MNLEPSKNRVVRSYNCAPHATLRNLPFEIVLEDVFNCRGGLSSLLNVVEAGQTAVYAPVSAVYPRPEEEPLQTVDGKV